MGINVNEAYIQASQLENSISQLNDAKRQLTSYRTTISNNWQSKEVPYILDAINRTMRNIDSSVGELSSLASDIRRTADAIRREEIEAEKKAKAEAEAKAKAAAAAKAASAAKAVLKIFK